MSVTSAEVTVTFQPSGHSMRVRKGRQLLAIIRDAKLPIGYSCRGQRVCTACAVWVAGEASKTTPQEEALLARFEERRSPAGEELRISCFVRVEANVSVRASYW